MATEHITLDRSLRRLSDGGCADGEPSGTDEWSRPEMYRAVIELAADATLLDDPDAVKELVEAIVSEFGFNLISYEMTRFAPVGVTGIGVIGESHVSVHTWPERRYAHVELLTCTPLPDTDELRQRFPIDDDCLREVRRSDP